MSRCLGAFDESTLAEVAFFEEPNMAAGTAVGWGTRRRCAWAARRLGGAGSSALSSKRSSLFRARLLPLSGHRTPHRGQATSAELWVRWIILSIIRQTGRGVPLTGPAGSLIVANEWEQYDR